MKNMTLENVEKACGGTYQGEPAAKNVEIKGLALDSRKMEPGFAFLATKGEKVDGHSFIPAVLEQGAACVICEQLPEGLKGNFILVEDSFQALKDIAEFYRQQLSIPVIGITGSVGKTSTKEYIAGILEQKYRVLRTEGNFNNEVGVPLTLLRIREEHEAAVLEMGINHFGEMRRLSRMVKPDICVLTNIGDCHLEFLKSREGVLKAKSEIFDFMKEDGIVYINGDDDMLRTIERVKNKRPVTFGLGAENDYYASQVKSNGLMGSEAVVHTPEGSFPVQIGQPGEHMVRNALAGTAVAEQLGLSEEEITAGIASVLPVGGRSSIVKKGSLTLIDDCYNANPASMRAALDLLTLAEGRTTAILGDMFELGSGEEQMHAGIGAYAVEKEISCLVCVGSLSAHMYQGALKAKEKKMCNTVVLYFKDREELLEKIDEFYKNPEEVTVLVKASHGMGFDEVVKRICG